VIETRLLSAWDGFIGSAALIAIIGLVFWVMVRAVKVGDVPRHLGVIVGIVILLVILPAVIVSSWNSMTFIQHIGLIALGLVIASLFGVRRHRAKGMRHR
jgi:hypothetical protein